MLIADITPRTSSAGARASPRRAATRNKLLVELHGIFRRAQKLYGLRDNPAPASSRSRAPRRLDLQVYSPEEIRALVRAADSEQDAAIYLTAAFTGLRRGELLALRWRDVDFAASTLRVAGSYAAARPDDAKSGRPRAVPLAPRSPRAGSARPARLLHRRRRPRLPRRARRLPRRLRAAPPLRQGARPRRPAPAALPRPAPHASAPA
jgi:integrase